MAALQLSFTLDTHPKVKTVHLLGSWDNYRGQLPMTKTASGRCAEWAGKFRFQTSTLKPGQRYWYYYILDGYHVYHDPDSESVVERTTKRTLNILDVPGNIGGGKPVSRAPAVRQEIPKGRGLSPSRILHPKPSKPYESQRFCQSAFATQRTMDTLTARFQATGLSDSDSDISASPPSSYGSSRGSSTSPSSISSLSDTGSPCSCQRYGVTKSGERVRIHCGGKRCGGSSPCETSDSDFDSCSSDSDQEYKYARSGLRREHIRVRR